LFKKFAPQNLNLMGIISSASLTKNQFFFVKNEKISRLLKILEKILQKVKTFHKVNPNKKIKTCLNSNFYENLQGGSTQMQNFRSQKFLCLLRISQ
jgi:hypothetical protein